MKSKGQNLPAGLAARELAVRLVAGVLIDERPFEQALSEAAAHPQFAGLEPRDRALARAQRFCASDGMSLLGTESMGVPVKIMVLGEPVFLCCAGCEKAVRMDEAKALELVKKLREESPKEQRPADRTLDLVKKLREENAKEQRPAGKDQ